MLTGKGLAYGGARVRTEATGYGCAFFVDEMLRARGESFDGKRVVVSGSGNVSIHTIEKVHQLGGRVVACSDSSGYVVDEKGIDLDLLRQIKEVDRGRIGDYAAARPDASLHDRGTVYDVPCDVAMPSATHNEIGRDEATTLVRNGCIAVGEGANMPTTPEGVEVFLEAGIAYGPGKAANSGGVSTSALEMQQNASRDSWSFEYSEQRLREIMSHVHERCRATAEEFGMPGNYVAGANIAGFTRVADAVLGLGLI